MAVQAFRCSKTKRDSRGKLKRVRNYQKSQLADINKNYTSMYRQKFAGVMLLITAEAWLKLAQDLMYQKNSQNGVKSPRYCQARHGFEGVE